MSLVKSITALAVLTCAGGFAALVEAGAPPGLVSDTVTISNGESMAIGTLTEAVEGTDGAIIEFTNLFGVFPTGNSALYGSYTVLTQPDGTISDVFGVIPRVTSGLGPVGPAANFDFALFSDGEIGSTTVPTQFVN